MLSVLQKISSGLKISVINQQVNNSHKQDFSFEIPMLSNENKKLMHREDFQA